jgi:hypothetical protein
MGDVMQQPAVKVRAFQPVRMTPETYQVLFRFDIRNANPLTVTFEHVVFKFTCQDRKLIKDVRINYLVPGYTIRGVELPVSLSRRSWAGLLPPGKPKAALHIAADFYPSDKSQPPVYFDLDSEITLPSFFSLALASESGGVNGATWQLQLEASNPNPQPLTLVKAVIQAQRGNWAYDFLPLPQSVTLPAAGKIVFKVQSAPGRLIDNELEAGDFLSGELEAETAEGLKIVVPFNRATSSRKAP